MSKYLITGGCGFIGSNLAEYLINNNEEVVVWDDLSTGKVENLPKEVIFENRDIRRKIVSNEKFDTIFHLAAQSRIQPSFKDPRQSFDINVTGTVNILEFAMENNSKVVYAGSSSAYDDVYANPYAFTKWAGEQHCKLYNSVYKVSVAIARFFNVYGPKQVTDGSYATVIGIFENQKIQKRKLTITGDGHKRRDFTHVNDIVAGLVAMSKDRWNAEIFNLGTGKNHSILELAELLNPVGIDFIPERPGEAEVTLADIDFTKQKLNWEPKIQLENYIKHRITQIDGEHEEKKNDKN